MLERKISPEEVELQKKLAELARLELSSVGDFPQQSVSSRKIARKSSSLRECFSNPWMSQRLASKEPLYD